MKCVKCGFENEDDSLFCVNCGASFEKNSFKKCVVCGKDMNEEDDFCMSCGSKQSDYIKCPECGEANLKTFKFCVKCGKSFDSIKDGLNETMHTSNLNTKPIVSVPNFEEHNTTSNDKTIIDNTEVYTTGEFIKASKPKSNVVMIILSIIGGLLVVGVIGFAIFKFVFNNNVQDIKPVDNNKVHEIKEIEKGSELKEEIKTIRSDKVSYFKLDFVDTVKIRTSPSLKGNHIGKIAKGCTLVGFDKTNADGYTWYKIGYDEWVADDGTFLSVSKIDLDGVEIVSGSYNMYRASNNTPVYESPSLNANSIGWVTKQTLIKGFEKIDNDGITWLKLTPCEYVKYSDFYIE